MSRKNIWFIPSHRHKTVALDGLLLGLEVLCGFLLCVDLEIQCHVATSAGICKQECSFVNSKLHHGHVIDFLFKTLEIQFPDSRGGSRGHIRGGGDILPYDNCLANSSQTVLRTLKTKGLP